MPIKHAFVNPVADDPSFLGTKPSDWNKDHVGTNDHGHTSTGDGGILVIGASIGQPFNLLINGGFDFFQIGGISAPVVMVDGAYNGLDRWYSLVQGSGPTMQQVKDA
jgi:hypothetical protein